MHVSLAVFKSTQILRPEYIQSTKELIIKEKCKYIVIHVRLDIGMFVDACTSVARAAGEWGDPDHPPSPLPPHTRFRNHCIRLIPKKNGKWYSLPLLT